MTHSIQRVPLNPSAESLLAANGLPSSDLRGSAVTLFGHAPENELLGIIGLEIYGPAALLRSLAVHDTRRGTGLGASLVAHAEQFAAQQGVSTLYLLTTTAAHFFERRGYSHIARDTAPASIAATSQFSGLCPSSSAFMRKSLGS